MHAGYIQKVPQCEYQRQDQEQKVNGGRVGSGPFKIKGEYNGM